MLINDIFGIPIDDPESGVLIDYKEVKRVKGDTTKYTISIILNNPFPLTPNNHVCKSPFRVNTTYNEKIGDIAITVDVSGQSRYYYYMLYDYKEDIFMSGTLVSNIPSNSIIRVTLHLER